MLSTAAVVTAMTVGLAGAGLAQDATPAAMEGHPSGPFPNHLHKGNCADLDPAPAVPLADLQFPEWVAAMAGEETEIEVVFPEPDAFGNAPIPVAVSTTEVAVPLADIIAGKHALNVHNPANPDDYVACGNIGGVPDERGDLFVGLGEFEGSGIQRRGLVPRQRRQHDDRRLPQPPGGATGHRRCAWQPRRSRSGKPPRPRWDPEAGRQPMPTPPPRD